MELDFVRVAPDDAEPLADFLTGDEWPFHVGGTPDRDTVLSRVAEGRYDGPSVRSFWIVLDGERVGLLRLDDLDDDTPVFDLRVGSAHRGRGIGRRAVEWLTRYVFTELPHVNRIEGTTRQDNSAMRRTFRRCGYVKEAHYRAAWPAADRMYDAVGYAILRTDWAGDRTTPVRWNDENQAAG